MMGQAKGNLIKGRLEILIIFLKSIFEHIDQSLLSQRGQLYYKKLLCLTQKHVAVSSSALIPGAKPNQQEAGGKSCSTSSANL